MPQDTEVGSPEWRVRQLSARMDARDTRLIRYEDYYTGAHRIQFATKRFRKTFGDVFADRYSDNWCALVVDAVEERCDVDGFRWAPNEDKGDSEAWDIWQRNNLDAESQVAHTEALINGESHVLVWWKDGTSDVPQLTIEHPRQMIVETAAGARNVRTAALKRWVGEDGYVYATLYLPDEIHKFISVAKAPDSGAGLMLPRDIKWKRREVRGETNPLPNPLGVVPVVPLYNRPRLLVAGESEIRSVIPNQDAINKLVIDMLVASEFAAFRQRWATGIELPMDEETGQLDRERLREMFPPDLVNAWMSGDPEANFGSFEATDLDNYVRAIENRVQAVASQTRTPPHYFYLKGSFPSGESIKSAETGLVAKARRKMRHWGEGWEEAMRLAFLVKGDAAKAAVMDAETIWKDPESRTEGEHVDATMKKQAIGVPWRILMEDLGYSQAKIDRMEALRMQEALEVGLSFDPFKPMQPSTNGNGQPEPVTESAG